ncbi:hypothetical protein LTS18_000273, partial [Coniosporium uncinatum]
PSRRLVRALPDDIEMVSPREMRTRPMYYNQEPEYGNYRDDAAPPGYVRVQSPAAYRRVERDDQDLRRVASLQHAQARVYSPVAPYAASEMRPRAASNMYSDRHAASQGVVREMSVRPTDPYMARPQSPGLMAPPPRPRSVVVDQYGNKYYAAPAGPDVRASMAPPSRRMQAEPYYERATTRAPTMRIMDAQEEEGFHRMPPPPSRRVYADEYDPEVPAQSVIRSTRQYSQRPPEPMRYQDEYDFVEAVSRRPPPPHFDEEMAPPPREYALPRSYSVRPEVVRRDEPPLVRYGSVHPGYAPQVPQRRYADEMAMDRAEMIPEYAGDGRRVSYRY